MPAAEDEREEARLGDERDPAHFPLRITCSDALDFVLVQALQGLAHVFEREHVAHVGCR